LVRRSDLLGRIALHAAGLAMVFHFVSLAEAFAAERTLLLASIHNSESLLAFVVMVGFMLVYWRYQTTTPGVFVFPLVFLLTFGLVAGSVVAQAKYGAVYFRDPKVLLSVLMWAVYVLMLYTRWNSGWRGRRAAYLATFAFLAAVVAWAANFISGVHRFVSP